MTLNDKHDLPILYPTNMLGCRIMAATRRSLPTAHRQGVPASLLLLVAVTALWLPAAAAAGAAAPARVIVRLSETPAALDSTSSNQRTSGDCC
jgi:hypothetical protein